MFPKLKLHPIDKHHLKLKETNIGMKLNNHWALVILSLTIFGIPIVSCERPSVFEDEDLINSLYQKAEDTVMFEGSHYTLETYIYRNLMPGGPIPEERPLISLLYLTNTDSLDIRDELKIEKLYIINESLVFKSIPEYYEENSLSDYIQSFICRKGPEWETGIKVDVIIRITDQSTNKASYLIARNQTIDKVE